MSDAAPRAARVRTRPGQPDRRAHRLQRRARRCPWPSASASRSSTDQQRTGPSWSSPSWEWPRLRFPPAGKAARPGMGPAGQRAGPTPLAAGRSPRGALEPADRRGALLERRVRGRRRARTRRRATPPRGRPALSTGRACDRLAGGSHGPARVDVGCRRPRVAAGLLDPGREAGAAPGGRRVRRRRLGHSPDAGRLPSTRPAGPSASRLRPPSASRSAGPHEETSSA